MGVGLRAKVGRRRLDGKGEMKACLAKCFPFGGCYDNCAPSFVILLVCSLMEYSFEHVVMHTCTYLDSCCNYIHGCSH